MANQQIKSGRGVLEGQEALDRQYKFFPHDSIVFEADVWDLQFRATTAGPPSEGKISFRAFSPSVKDEVKNFVAHLCWGEGLSNGTLNTTLITLRKAIPLLEERHQADFSFLKLSQADALAIEDLFAPTNRGREHLVVIARFAKFLRDRHAGEPADFRPNPQTLPFRRKYKRTYSDGLEQVIPDDVSRALMEALYQERIALEEEITRNSPERLSTARLYPVVLLLLLFSGKRASEILLLKQDCLREPTPDELKEVGYDGLWLAYKDTKAHMGEREVFIQEPASHLVWQEVTRIRAQISVLAEQSGLDYLFLTNTRVGRTWLEEQGDIRRLNDRGFTIWLSGRTGDDKQVLRRGFIHRHNIKYQGEYYHLNPHQTRHTLAHKAYMGGASYVAVGGHLGHKQTKTGLSPMTGVYVHGQEREVKSIREMNERRLVVGKAAPLIENRSVNLRVLDPSDVAIWREQGMVVHPTLYGH